MLIRAKEKDALFDSYLYIYSIYLAKIGSGENHWYFLCSSANENRLIVFISDEIKDIEILDIKCEFYNCDIDSYILDRIYKNDWEANKACHRDIYYLHPVLNYFLENQYDTYEGIIEGCCDSWLKFEEKLGFRP